MNRIHSLVLMSLISAFSPVRAVDPPGNALQVQGEALQKGKIPKRYIRQNIGQSLAKKRIHGWGFEGDEKDPLSDKVPPLMMGKAKGPGGPWVDLRSAKTLSSRARQKLESVSKKALKRRLESHAEGEELVTSAPIRGDVGEQNFIRIPRGAGIEKFAASLNLGLAGLSETSFAGSAIKEARNKNGTALKRIRRFAIEHLKIKVTAGSSELTERVLKGALKNPYGQIRSVVIRTSGKNNSEKPIGFLLPLPQGGKTYPHKLQSVSLTGEIKADVIDMVEKSGKIRSLRLEGGARPFQEGMLKRLVQTPFSFLKKLSIQSDFPVLEEIKNAPCAAHLTSLEMEAEEGSMGHDVLTGFSQASFPALEELKLSHFQDLPELMNALFQNTSALKSFSAYDCGFSLLEFSGFLQKLSDSAVNLKIEAVNAFEKGDGEEFYQLPLQMAENLKFLTLKECAVTDKRIAYFFGTSEDFFLYSLDLSKNDIGMDGLRAVFSKRFLNLKELNLSGNRLGADSVLFLARNCKNFPNLKTLILSKCFFDPLYATYPEGKSETEWQEEFREAFPKAKIFYTDNEILRE